MTSHLKTPVGAMDHLRGSLRAPIILCEYGDFECSFCAKAYGELKVLEEDLGDKLCFAFRNFPLTNIHPYALRASSFAEAAATVGKFWEMHDMLFEHQHTLDDAHLVAFARRLDLSEELIQSALNGAFDTKIQSDFSGGVSSGVNGTPCLFINGERWNGPATAAALLAAVG